MDFISHTWVISGVCQQMRQNRWAIKLSRKNTAVPFNAITCNQKKIKNTRAIKKIQQLKLLDKNNNIKGI